MKKFEEMMEQLLDRLNAHPEALVDAAGVYQFDIAGAGNYQLIIEGEQARLVTPPADTPVVTIKVALEDLEQMRTGELNPASAFMAGRVQLEGDWSQALKLQTLFG
ncbi:MAG: SCP2 sterol-binding domain-containing protein [Firmicutes bacterium]|nr:SCP2 sterol-binding domain-containing protein [Bacillota bacterium]